MSYILIGIIRLSRVQTCQGQELLDKLFIVNTSHIPQVQPPKLSIFPDNDSLQNRVDAITLFLARVIFPHNYSSILSNDVFACLDHILFININIYHTCVHN